MGVKRYFSDYYGLPRSIYILFFARIINSMGAFVYPFLTFFLTDKMGMREQETGLYFMMLAISSIPGSFLGGYLSDRIGRKKILIVSQGLAALSFIPCAFLGNSLLIPYFLILANFFGGAAHPANSAITADLTDESNRKEAFSLIYLGINVGFAIGPLIAGLLYYNHTKWIFLGDAITTLLSLLLVVKFVDESKPSEDKVEKSYNLSTKERAEEGSIFTILLKRPALIIFAMVSIIYSFIYAQHSYTTPLQMKSLFGMNKGTKMYGTLGTTNALMVLIMTLFVTSITKKLKPILNISLAGIFYAIGFGMLYFAKAYPLFIVSTIIWTVGEILNVTNSGVYIANHAPMTHRGRVNAIIPLITGVGSATAPYITGGFIEIYGVGNVWPLIFALALLGVILMYGIYLKEFRKDKKMNIT
ncbi:MFS transporter [Clostridium sp. D2Q-14]|uniref:MDR family MFS transporter n=1 Tax=Anaeromonas gelatinilytica TaxID=2683194 RepID=UPI00193B74AD|nr:MFS transporter [Anaeromonas gelatinilytica]MBS4535053.1 MFS transporter [Anaeromonas gelatinilytica]